MLIQMISNTSAESVQMHVYNLLSQSENIMYL
jgi:hypothetical protein